VAKVTLKSNGDEALNAGYFFSEKLTAMKCLMLSKNCCDEAMKRLTLLKIEVMKRLTLHRLTSSLRHCEHYINS
jgi:hypothetical protein